MRFVTKMSSGFHLGLAETGPQRVSPTASSYPRHMPSPGERWGYREKPRTPGGSFSPVEVLQLGPPRLRRVKVKWA